MPTEVKTSVGRLVWGHPGKSQIKKDLNTKQPKLNKEGQPIEQWAFGIAFPKAEFQAMIWPAMAQEAATGYPQGTPPKFAWKYVDGDGIDSNGQPFSKREGYAGCYILTISSEAFAPPVYKFQNGAYKQMEAHEYKTGDYFAIAVKFQVNVSQPPNTPSLYVNPVALEHVGYGQEIQNGPDPMALFGGQQRALPPGASATPLASSGHVSMPGTGPQMQHQQPGPQPGQQPQYQQPQPGYTPPHDPRFTGGPQPGQMQPGQMQYQQPGPQPGQMQHQPGPQPGQMQYQQPGGPQPHMMQQPGQMQHAPQPAHDFVQNAGQQQQYQQPAPQPGQMQYQQPGGPQPHMMQQPGQMQPGMMPPNR